MVQTIKRNYSDNTHPDNAPSPQRPTPSLLRKILLTILVTVRIVLGLGEVRHTHGFQRLCLDDDRNALGHQVEVLVKRQGDTLRDLQSHGDLEIRWVQPDIVLSGKVAHLGYVLSQVLEVAVLLGVHHHLLHGLAEVTRMLHGL